MNLYTIPIHVRNTNHTRTFISRMIRGILTTDTVVVFIGVRKPKFQEVPAIFLTPFSQLGPSLKNTKIFNTS